MAIYHALAKTQPTARLIDRAIRPLFPKALAVRLLKLFGYQGDIALDPFNGVGTTTLCAAETGRNYIGVEVEYIYLLNEWFKKSQYKDALDYVISVGCQYRFNRLPLKKLGLPALKVQ